MASNAACSRRWRVGYNSVLIRTSCWIQTVIHSYHPKYEAVATFISPFLASQSVSDIPHWSYSRLCVKVPIKSHTSLSPAIVPKLTENAINKDFYFQTYINAHWTRSTEITTLLERALLITTRRKNESSASCLHLQLSRLTYWMVHCQLMCCLDVV